MDVVTSFVQTAPALYALISETGQQLQSKFPPPAPHSMQYSGFPRSSNSVKKADVKHWPISYQKYNQWSGSVRAMKTR